MAGQDTAELLEALLNNKGNGTVYAFGSTASAVPIPAPSVASSTTVTLTGNVTITLPAPTAGAAVKVLVTQDGTGSRLVTWASVSGTVKFAGGTPTLTTTAAATDLLTFECLDGTNWVGIADKNVS